MSYRSLDEVVRDLEEGSLVSGMIPVALMDFVDERNVDHVIAELPSEHRAFVLEWAHVATFAPAHELLHLSGVSNLSDIRPEDNVHPREEVFFRALRSWFGRHPWPEPE
jgi:hypothetical protein